MANIKLVLEYEGTAYYGWQIQPDVPTVQGKVEEALLKIFKRKIKVVSAARTDRGVHAKGQVVNFKIPCSFSPFSMVQALNSILPSDIRVRKAEEVSDNFHARYSACYKVYRYFIYNHFLLSPWLRRFSWWVRVPLNCDLMREAASYLLGRHDFSSFQNSGSPSENPIKFMEKIEISKKGFLISIQVKADSFLYKMVRNITGTLVEVGRGKISPEKMRVILEARDRRKAGPTAPPQGLFLWKVGYPPQKNLKK
ncbi:MAG TPA: tRNA pseudouridine(38-40) synthase TruA [Candidatus Aerophobetes bacterium]|uniref:tRNA pseudouridine synthase A n=1 Tax=Aerophobetes bacterium TaxID=2030807 RepID=A0A7V5HZ03_UNCAE|nr:tRNA pseudouridine(38-40) synthase TruA [Candidatus Aerophobetes bacterium]